MSNLGISFKCDVNRLEKEFGGMCTKKCVSMNADNICEICTLLKSTVVSED